MINQINNPAKAKIIARVIDLVIITMATTPVTTPIDNNLRFIFILFTTHERRILC